LLVTPTRQHSLYHIRTATVTDLFGSFPGLAAEPLDIAGRIFLKKLFFWT